MNMRGVFLHVMADALGSVVVIISAIIIWQTDWEYKYYVDPGDVLTLLDNNWLSMRAVHIGVWELSNCPRCGLGHVWLVWDIFEDTNICQLFGLFLKMSLFNSKMLGLFFHNFRLLFYFYICSHCRWPICQGFDVEFVAFFGFLALN